LNDPHAPEPQVAVQLTPASLGSFVTVAVKAVVAFTSIELSATLLVNEIEMGTAMIVKLVLLICDGLLVTVAVIVTVVPIGTTEGAV
jgi:hypothetical protein